MADERGDREAEPPRFRGPGIARASALLVALTAISQVLGYVRDAVIASTFGAGSSLDAYLVAQGFLNLAVTLVALALARAVVPPVSRAVAAGDRNRVERTTGTVLTVAALVVLCASVAMYAGADLVVATLAPGFDPDTRDLAASLTRIMIVAAVFVALTDILAAVGQAHGRFFFSGVQGVPFNVVMIAAAASFGAAHGVEALAIGFVVGSVARMLLQLPAIRAERIALRPRLALRDEDVREVFRLVPPLLIGSAVVNVNTLVDRAVGSAQGEGVITALSFGWRIVTLVDMLLVVTVVAALYPAFSRAGAEDDRVVLRSLVDRSSRGILVVLAPVIALLIVAAEPVVEVLFGRGSFDAQAVDMTATAVVAYAVAAAAVALRSIASRGCLAVGDSRSQVIAAVVAMTLNVAGDLTLGVAYGIPGLAASTSISMVAGAALLLFLLERRHDAVTVRSVAAAAMRVSLAAALGAAAVALLGITASADGGLDALLRCAAAGAVIAVVYLAALVAMRSSELREAGAIIRRALRGSGGA